MNGAGWYRRGERADDGRRAGRVCFAAAVNERGTRGDELGARPNGWWSCLHRQRTHEVLLRSVV